MSEKEVSVVIAGDGSIKMIYDDTVSKTLQDIGKSTVQRASHVEPSKTKENCWEVDLSPVNGPTIDGFLTRKEALDYEIDYLNKNVLKTN